MNIKSYQDLLACLCRGWNLTGPTFCCCMPGRIISLEKVADSLLSISSFRNRGIEERIPERSDSAATVEAKRLQARKFAEQLKLLNDARDLARKTIKELEAKEIAKNGC